MEKCWTLSSSHQGKSGFSCWKTSTAAAFFHIFVFLFFSTYIILHGAHFQHFIPSHHRIIISLEYVESSSVYTGSDDKCLDKRFIYAEIINICWNENNENSSTIGMDHFKCSNYPTHTIQHRFFYHPQKFSIQHNFSFSHELRRFCQAEKINFRIIKWN